MIVNWTGDGAKVIPCIMKDEIDGENKKTIVGDYVCLAPGYNDLSDEMWKNARPSAMYDIESGRIVEELTKLEKGEKVLDGGLCIPIDGVDYIPAKLKDINRSKIQAVVKGTYHLPTLKKWMDEEMRQDVRLDLHKQLQLVNKTDE